MADDTLKRKPPERISHVKNPESSVSARPTGIRAPHGARVFELSWSDGEVHSLPHTILRGYCPCAGCQGHSGTINFQAGRNLDLRDIKTVGNYALGLVWGDQHESGIYSFTFLRQLGALLQELGEERLIALGTLPRRRVVSASSGDD